MSSFESVEMAVADRSRLVSMARAGLPGEMCALLGGQPGPPIRVMHIIAVRNVAASSNRFILDGAEMLAAEDEIEAAGLEVVGLAHSHPASHAEPSQIDLADAEIYDSQNQFIQVLVSLQGFAPAVKVWRYGTKSGQRCAFEMVLKS